MALFGFGRPRLDDAARRRVEAWSQQAWAGDPRSGDGGFIVKANEIVCADPACPGVETVILILAAKRRSRAFKVPKPLSEVTQDDVARAIGAPEHPVPDS